MSNNVGRLVWYELLTSDPAAAIAFYTEVVGWKTQPWESGDYTMFVGTSGPLGGVNKLPEQAKAMGAPPHWMANVQIANLAESLAKVKSLGGKVLHEETVPKVGKIGVILDPQGASMALFQPESEMTPHDGGKPGEFGWNELMTTDHEAAFAFYSAIAGWERISEYDMGPMGKYLLWGKNGKQLGGMMTAKGMKTPDGKDVPPNWMYYVTTADLDAALARAKGKGARVINGPMEVPGGQRVVLLFDPQGAAFALVTPPTGA
jgi:uncharacterized protein